MYSHLATLSPRAHLLVAALSGLLYPLSFAPYGWYLVQPLAMALLLMLWVHATPRQAALRGFVFGFTAFLSGIYWITISVHTFGGAPLFLAILLMLSLVAFMAGYLALLGWVLTRWFASGSRASGGALYWWAAFPALWMLLEWARGWVLTGFAWLSPGYAHVDSVLGGYLPVGGVLLVGWVAALTAAALARWLLEPTRRSFVAVLLTSVLWGGGALLTQVAWTADNGQVTDAAMVQGAVPQDQKWLPEQLQPTMQLYFDLSRAHADADLIIWPEAAIPRYKHQLVELWDQLRRISAANDTEFLVGTVEYDADTTERYNSVTVFSAHPQTSNDQVYQKRHLVPFGEYFPVPEFVRDRMRLMNLPYQNFSAGKDGQPALRAADQHLGVSICYEDVFGNEFRDRVAGTSLLVNVSNDAWFGGSLAPHQHLQIARTRAAESARYLLRATNTGITAVINRRGQSIQQTPQFEPVVLRATVPGTQGMTPYTRFGDAPWIVAFVLLLGFGLWRTRPRSPDTANLE